MSANDPEADLRFELLAMIRYGRIGQAAVGTDLVLVTGRRAG
jgi:hypothetical protein